ncbi:hypothetical protein [Bradyrhizobium sp. USDA 3364]
MFRPWSPIGLVWFVLATRKGRRGRDRKGRRGRDRSACRAETLVNFPSLDGATDLIGHLERPEGDAPRPAVVLMRGCSGLKDAFPRVLDYLKQHLE